MHSAAAASEGPTFDVSVMDSDTNGTLETVAGSARIGLPDDADVGLVITEKPGERIDRVYLQAAPGADRACQTTDGKAASLDDERPFRFDLKPMADCQWTVTAYDDLNRTSSDLDLRLQDGLVADAMSAMPPRREDYSRGTQEASSLELGAVGTRQTHGVRIHCTVSHLSYDDPIVYPDQPDKAHLHMFFGNKSANAYSKLSNLKAANRTTCDGGTNLESAYWMPALFNQNDEAVLPEHLLIYYKSFILAPIDDRHRLPDGLVKPIPDGLEMLAGPTAAYPSGDPAQYGNITRDGDQLKLMIIFPQCVATHADGRPVLSHRDMPGDLSDKVNSHMAYQVWAQGSADGCPSSHPYRIPGLFINAWFDVDPDSNWYLASDKDRSNPGHSLHADYIAAWNAADMERVVRCNIERRSCMFAGGAAWAPDRFYDMTGERRYLNVWVLEAEEDRTPWGNRFTTMRHGEHTDGEKCADEGGRCSVTSNTTVRYGANGQWVTKTLSGSFTCSNATFGRDPIFGVKKACYAEPDAAPTDDWTKCADEGGRCSLSAATSVRYGANGQWITKTMTGSFACSNGTFGRDPIFGLKKACYTKASTTTPTSWSKCADEGKQCNLPSAKTVRYGANGKWTTKTFSGTFTCSNATFGSDPVPGVVKACYVGN